MIRGIDISYWQATTPTLTGYDFAIVRRCYGMALDSRYQMHAANVRDAELALGAYAFGVNGSGAAQARTFVDASGDADFWALDLEAEVGKVPMTDAQAREFIATVKASGRQCGLYHSRVGFPELGQSWNWVADWRGIIPDIPWAFWQTRGNPLDLDTFNGDVAALAAFVAQQQEKHPVSTLLELAQAAQHYAGLPATDHNTAALRRNLELLVGRLSSGTEPVVLNPPAEPVPVPTPAQIYAKFLDAADAVLIHEGKPHGRDGAERGSLTRDQCLAIVAGLGIPNALEILAAGGYSFGPAPAPATIA